MALKFFIFAFLTIVFKGEASVPAALPLVSDATYDPLPQYYFGYDVQDALTGDSKTQVETRNGDVVLGQYSLNDPDGTRRIVDYSADAINGFNAVVRKTPLAVATPLLATAALTPVVEPAAVRAAVAPLVAARALPPVSVQSANPASLRSAPATPSSPTPLSRSSSPDASPRSAPSNAPPSPSPSSISVSTLNIIRSPSLLRSSNPLPSQNQPSAELPSIPQLRAALNSSPVQPSPSAPLGQAAPEAPASRSASTLSESVEVNAATQESGPAAPQGPPRNGPVAAAAPLVTGAPVIAAPRFLAPGPVAYAAAPALAYSGLVAPVAYNVW